VRLRFGGSVRIRVIEGVVGRLRVALPASDQAARFRLGNVRVHVELAGLPAAVPTLQSLGTRGAVATACIVGDEDARWGNLCWLVSQDGRSVVTRAYDQKARHWRLMRWWLPAAILSGLALPLTDRYLFAGVSWMFLPWLLSCLTLIFSLAGAAFSIMSLWRGFRQQPALERAGRLLQLHRGSARQGTP
jgi:hypothetical protein